MPTNDEYERRVAWALRKKADDAYMYRAAMGLGLRRESVSEAGVTPLLAWAAERARELARHAEANQVPIPVFDQELDALRKLCAAAVDVAGGGPLRRLERRVVPPVIPSGATGAVRLALGQLPLDEDPDSNLRRVITALRGEAPRPSEAVLAVEESDEEGRPTEIPE